MRTRTLGLTLVALATVALSIAPSPSAQACLHAAGAHSKPVTQSGQQAIVLHDGTTEDLILRVNYEGLSAPSLAWIVPVPSAPTTYEAMDPGLFEAMGEWIDLRRDLRNKPRSAGRSADTAKGIITLLPKVEVGPFAIQPIQASGSEAATALNEWMTENGFAAIPSEGLAYYVERGWTFLAIKVDPKDGGSFDRSGGLPPLRVTFESEQAVYPLKLSTHMGRFASRIYLVTARPLPPSTAEALATKGFESIIGDASYTLPERPPKILKSNVDTFAPGDAPEGLRPLLAARFPDETSLHMAVLLSERVNDPTTDEATVQGQAVTFEPARWSEDLMVGVTSPTEPNRRTEAKAKAKSGEASGTPTDDGKAGDGKAKSDSKAGDGKAGDNKPKSTKPGGPTGDAASSKGCGCQQSPAPAGWAALSLLLLATRRRSDRRY